MKNDLVSIIIPVYNGQKFLGNCIESVTNQTYENLEIILINDASTDNSLEICQRYANTDTRIKLINLKTNGGQSHARNVGVEAANGTWIGFCDNDDTYEPTMIETLVKNAQKHNVKISGCGNYRHQNNSTIKCNLNNRDSGIVNGPEIATHILYRPENTGVEVGTKIYHKSLKSKLVFPEGWQLEDYLVNIKIFYSVDKIYFDNCCLYNWIIREDSQSKQTFFDNRLSYIPATESLRTGVENTKVIPDNNQTISKIQAIDAVRIGEFCVKCRLLEDMTKTGDPQYITKAKQLLPEVKQLKQNIHLNKNFKLKSYIHCLLRLGNVKKLIKVNR